MRKNEPIASKRVLGPVGFFDADGKLKSGLTFSGAGESQFGYIGAALADSTNDWTEYGTTGLYYLQLEQSETNHDTAVIGRLRKATYDDVFEVMPIDNTPDVNVLTMSTDSFSSAALSSAAVTKIAAGIPASGSGATFYKTALSRTIATGTGSGGVANTVGYDQTYDNVANSGGDIDFYYTFDASAITGAIGVVVDWTGYLDDVTNAATLIVEAYNWGLAAYQQIGTIPPAATAVEINRQFTLAYEHTQAGVVRIRFRGTGYPSATLKTDRILLGCGLLSATDAIADAVWDEARVGHVTAGTFGEGVKVQSVNDNAIDVGSFEQPTFELLSQMSALGYLVVAGAPSPTRTTLRLDAGLGVDFLKDKILKVVEGTGYGWHAVVKSYDTATGDTVLEGTGFPSLVDVTSVIACYDSAAPASRIRDAEITQDKFSTIAKSLLFGIIHTGDLLSYVDAGVVLNSGTFTDHQLRGCLLHVYDGDGKGEAWIIADNGGASGRTLTLVGGDAWAGTLQPYEIDNSQVSQVVVVRFGESFGTLFDQGGPARTSGRQHLHLLAAAAAGTGDGGADTAGDNVGQPNEGVPATFYDEEGNTTLVVDVDPDTGSKTATWTKAAP